MPNIAKPQVDAASLEILSSLVNLNLQRSLVMPGKLIDLSSEAVGGVDKIKIRKFNDLAVGTKAANTPVAYGISTLAVDELDLDQHKYVAFLMEEFAKIQGPQAFMEELAQNASIKLAQDFDAYLINTVRGGANADSLETAAALEPKDFINARAYLDGGNVPQQGRYIGLHPDDYAKVLAISSFVEADKIGSANIVSGQVGMLYGMSVIVNTGFTADELVVWHQGCAAGAMQLSPSIRTQYDPDELGDKWVLHTIYGAEFIKPESAIILT
jgi:hypothetical protein